jgi:hypothetical protein
MTSLSSSPPWAIEHRESFQFRTANRATIVRILRRRKSDAALRDGSPDEGRSEADRREYREAAGAAKKEADYGTSRQGALFAF